MGSPDLSIKPLVFSLESRDPWGAAEFLQEVYDAQSTAILIFLIIIYFLSYCILTTAMWGCLQSF